MEKRAYIMLYDSTGRYLNLLKALLEKYRVKRYFLHSNSKQSLQENLKKYKISTFILNGSEKLGEIKRVIKRYSPSSRIVLLKSTDENKGAPYENGYDEVIYADNENSLLECMIKHAQSIDNHSFDSVFAEKLDESFLLSAFINNPSSLFVVYDPYGKIEYFNKGCSEITGYSSDDVVGKVVWEFLMPYDNVEVMQNSFEHMRAGFSVPFWEIPWKTKYGEKVFIYWSNTIYMNENDETEFILSIGKDITSFVRAKKESELSKLFMKRILDSIDASVFVLNRRYEIIEANKHFISEYKEKGKVLGRKCFTVLYDNDKPCFRYGFDCPFEHISRTYTNFRGEKGSLVNGGYVMEVMGSPVFNEKGGIENIVVLQKDITKRKQIEAKIIHDIEEKKAMLQEIHHRVKNNLQIISSLIGLEVSKISDVRARSRMVTLRNRMRTMAMIHDQLYQSSELSKINLVQYINDFLMSVKRWYHGCDITFKVKSSHKEVYTIVDKAVSFGLILYELISNTIEHAYPNGFEGKRVVDIGIKKTRNDFVELYVKDQGVGIGENIVQSVTDVSGLYLANILAKDQLDGEFEIKADNGTHCLVRFKYKD